MYSFLHRSEVSLRAVRLFIEPQFPGFLPGPEAITKSREKAINNTVRREKMKNLFYWMLR